SGGIQTQRPNRRPHKLPRPLRIPVVRSRDIIPSPPANRQLSRIDPNQSVRLIGFLARQHRRQRQATDNRQRSRDSFTEAVYHHIFPFSHHVVNGRLQWWRLSLGNRASFAASSLPLSSVRKIRGHQQDSRFGSGHRDVRRVRQKQIIACARDRGL